MIKIIITIIKTKGEKIKRKEISIVKNKRKKRKKKSRDFFQSSLRLIH